jgi:hypothetical protein
MASFYGSGSIGSAAALRARPVCFELAAVWIGSLRHEFERASRQVTDRHPAAPDCDHRVVLGVLGMEMGRFAGLLDAHASSSGHGAEIHPSAPRASRMGGETTPSLPAQ